jgi:hypothetical protein
LTEAPGQRSEDPDHGWLTWNSVTGVGVHELA